METKTLRVWRIGLDGTEYFAATSEEEIKEYYRLNSPDTAEEDLRENFEEVLDLDEEFDFNDDDTRIKTSWRKLADGAELPYQIATGYL